MKLDIQLDLTTGEAYWLEQALDEYTDNHYNEIVCIVLDRLREAIKYFEDEENGEG